MAINSKETDEYLTDIIQHRQGVFIFLESGLKLKGLLTAYDDVSYILNGRQCIKRAFVSSIDLDLSN